MPSCRVSECSNRSGGGVRLFSIPKRSRDIDIAKKWLKSVWDKELDDEQFALLMKEEFRVCAEHFVESDFDARGKLKADAVPSRFPWNGGQQRQSTISKTKTLPNEHKSSGALVGKLTRALKAAESLVDGEIKDIDRWILQLEAQVDHLRNKREKLVLHKAELGRSLGSPSAIKSEAVSQSSLSGTSSFVMNNGTNVANNFNFINSTTNPGESLFLSNDYSATVDDDESDDVQQQLQAQRRLKTKPVRRSGDEALSLTSDRYSFDGNANNHSASHLFLPPVPTPPESTEAAAFAANLTASTLHEQIGYPVSAVTSSSSSPAHNHHHRQFATRRKNLKPTRRIDLTATAAACFTSAGDNFSDEKNPLPSSSTVTSASPDEPMALSNNHDAGSMECDEEGSCGQRQCDLTSFSQSQYK